MLVRTAAAIRGKQGRAAGQEIGEEGSRILVLVSGGALGVGGQLGQGRAQHLEEQLPMSAGQGLAHRRAAVNALESPVNVVTLGLPQPGDIDQAGPDGG